MVICLLLLAGGLRPWKGLGLEFLLVLSIPIDIWALGLCGRTVLLERLNIDPQSGLGKRLWWKWALFSVIYLPLLYFIVGFVTSASKAVTTSIIETIKENVWVIPVAEQITIELVMWGSVASAVLVLLIIGWFYGLGALAQGEVKSSKSKDGNFEQIVYFWDKIRIPADQGLLLTAFTFAGVVLVFLFWVLLPETTPHPHDEYEYSNVVKIEPPVKPLEVLKNTEKVLKKAELTIVELEKEKDASGDTQVNKEKKPDKAAEGKIKSPPK
ncbi:MAG: hypothetical protein NPIRA01_31920 [Nitrospirales bacterium]|nr:MAG: hypothetical protein NPIRA01_31920 [Nitrospirales bacterium]